MKNIGKRALCLLFAAVLLLSMVVVPEWDAQATEEQNQWPGHVLFAYDYTNLSGENKDVEDADAYNGWAKKYEGMNLTSSHKINITIYDRGATQAAGTTITHKLCELPAAEDTVAAYKTQTYSTAQCDAFAKQMAENMGLIVDLTTYYQEYAYYNLRPGGILMVYYHDGSYEFMSAAHWEQTNWTEADRPLIEKALADYPVHIPAAAEFYYEGDGWHNFTVCRYMDGALMYDGTLRARYADNGNVEEVENYLSAYTFYEKVSIISAEQAFDRLKAGCFNDGGYFEHVKPSEITVTECVLDYQVDTKGFYQPVYIFSMEATDGSYDYSVMIPAMK